MLLFDIEVLDSLSSGRLDLAVVAQFFVVLFHATIDLGAIKELEFFHLSFNRSRVVVLGIWNVFNSVGDLIRCVCN